MSPQGGATSSTIFIHSLAKCSSKVPSLNHSGWTENLQSAASGDCEAAATSSTGAALFLETDMPSSSTAKANAPAAPALSQNGYGQGLLTINYHVRPMWDVGDQGQTENGINTWESEGGRSIPSIPPDTS